MSTRQRIAVITGASRGLGRETARQLAELGHITILTARTAAQVREGLAEIAGSGQVDGHVLDVADPTSIAAFFDWLGTHHGRLDILVNNAGRSPGSFSETMGTRAEDIAAAIDNNALSVWRMMQHALPEMNRGGFGRIVNVSSGMGALNGMNSGVVPYRISKTAMNAMTRIASNEVRGDVKVNSVCPGWVRTDLGGPRANLSIPEGVEGIVWAATLPADGPNGGFFRHGKPIDW